MSAGGKLWLTRYTLQGQASPGDGVQEVLSCTGLSIYSNCELAANGMVLDCQGWSRCFFFFGPLRYS